MPTLRAFFNIIRPVEEKVYGENIKNHLIVKTRLHLLQPETWHSGRPCHFKNTAIGARMHNGLRGRLWLLFRAVDGWCAFLPKRNLLQLQQIGFSIQSAGITG